MQVNAVDPKHPSASEIYTADWSASLNSGATITTSAWSLSSSEITNVADAVVTGSLKTSIKISGGIEGSTYYLTNVVTTSDGESLARTFALKVQTEGVNA